MNGGRAIYLINMRSRTGLLKCFSMTFITLFKTCDSFDNLFVVPNVDHPAFSWLLLVDDYSKVRCDHSSPLPYLSVGRKFLPTLNDAWRRKLSSVPHVPMFVPLKVISISYCFWP